MKIVAKMNFNLVNFEWNSLVLVALQTERFKVPSIERHFCWHYVGSKVASFTGGLLKRTPKFNRTIISNRQNQQRFYECMECRFACVRVCVRTINVSREKVIELKCAHSHWIIRTHTPNRNCWWKNCTKHLCRSWVTLKFNERWQTLNRWIKFVHVFLFILRLCFYFFCVCLPCNVGTIRLPPTTKKTIDAYLHTTYTHIHTKSVFCCNKFDSWFVRATPLLSHLHTIIRMNLTWFGYRAPAATALFHTSLFLSLCN